MGSERENAKFFFSTQELEPASTLALAEKQSVLGILGIASSMPVP